MVYAIMERRIFKFGKNSIALIIPKRWIDKNRIQAGSSILITESESGDLVISPSGAAKSEIEIVAGPNVDPEILDR
ncbi:MAG: AbrB/MazE/SpoVT family DNA-binding domain-containing protein, partial [Candidatus Micrarchaeaceae archaeon]